MRSSLGPDVYRIFMQLFLNISIETQCSIVQEYVMVTVVLLCPLVILELLKS